MSIHDKSDPELERCDWDGDLLSDRSCLTLPCSLTLPCRAKGAQQCQGSAEVAKVFLMLLLSLLLRFEASSTVLREPSPMQHRSS